MNANTYTHTIIRALLNRLTQIKAGEIMAPLLVSELLLRADLLKQLITGGKAALSTSALHGPARSAVVPSEIRYCWMRLFILVLQNLV